MADEKDSKSNKFLGERNKGNYLSPNAYRAVSQYRKELLDQEVEQGLFRDREYETRYKNGKLQSSGIGEAVSSSTIRKTGQVSSFTSGLEGGGSGADWRGSGSTMRQVPEVYSPLWLMSNLNLPRDRATMNAWCRSFMALNPIVQNAILLHSTYPISKLNITCKHKHVQDFFETMNEELDLLNVCAQLGQEYWALGEAFPYADLDQNKGKWSKILLQNPDFMTVKRTVITGEPIISLRPDENLRRICVGNRPSDLQQRESLHPSIVEHVRKGENIPLSNFYVSHFARRLSPYEVRGTSLIVSCFRSLMLFDRLRESKFVQADNMITPLTLVKVGSSEHKPTPEDLEKWRQIFESATYDKDFKIFTHQDVAVERVGYNGAIVDISQDITQLIKEIYIGLMVPSAVMDGGSDTTYANAGVALDVLKQRYMQFRNLLSNWLRRKIFAPISKIHDFYEIKDGKKTLIVPEVEWNHMSLFDAGDYVNNLTNLSSSSPPKVSTQTLHKSLGLDWEDEMRKIRQEAVQSMIHQKELEAISKKTLTELRSMPEDGEIKETPEENVPGQTSATTSPPSQDMSGGMVGGTSNFGGGPELGGGLGGGPELGGGLGGLGGLGGEPGGGPGAPPSAI